MKIFSNILHYIRCFFIKKRFGSCGQNVKIDRGVLLQNPKNISIGNNVHLRHGCMLYAGNGTSSGNIAETPFIKIGNDVHIKENAVLNTYGGFIIVGDNAVIGQNSVIYGNGGVTIGDNSGLGPLCSVIASNHVFDALDIPFYLQGETKKGIIVANNVWCASSVTLCDGITIEKNSVIGAGSVVRKDVPANAVVLGNPAKVTYFRS